METSDFRVGWSEVEVTTGTCEWNKKWGQGDCLVGLRV